MKISTTLKKDSFTQKAVLKKITESEKEKGIA